MKSGALFCLTAVIWATTQVAFAGQTAGPGEKGLAESLDAIEQIDAQLLDIQQQLETAPSWRARRQHRAKIWKLKAERERLLEQIARTVEGLRLPADREGPAETFQDQLDRHQEHHEIILESNVDSRLRSN